MVEGGERVPPGISHRDRTEWCMRLATHQPVYELAASGMTEEVGLPDCRDSGCSQVREDSLQQGVRPCGRGAHRAGVSDGAPIVIAFYARPGFVGECGCYD